METEPVDQVVGKGVQEQTKRIGQEAMTAKPVGRKAVLELFDPVLALPALVIEAKHLGTAAGAVGNQEAKIGAGGGVLGFGNNAAQSRPSAGAMAEAGEGALWQMGTTIAASQATLQSSGTTTKHDIGGNADGVVNAEELAELIKNREGKTRIGTQSDRQPGKLTQQTTQDAQEQRHDASMTGGGATAQTGCQQTAGMPLEDQQRVIHVLV